MPGILKGVAGIDEEVGLESAGDDLPCLCSHRLEGPAAGRPDQDLLLAGRAAVQAAGGGLGDQALLVVHGVMADVLGLHGPECADPDVQRHLGLPYLPVCELGEQSLGKVEAGGGRGDRAGLSGIYGLIIATFLCGGFALDVVRQGHLAVEIQLGPKIVAEELQGPEPVGAQVLYLGVKGLAEINARADLQLAGGAHQGVPEVVRAVPGEKHLDLGAAFLAPHQTRRYHLGVVEHQAVTWLEKMLDFKKGSLADLTALAVDNHEAGMVSWRDRMLRNQFLRQRELIGR